MPKNYVSNLSLCKTKLDNSLPFLYAEKLDVLLKNPDRGLRMESYITLGENLCSYPNNTEDPYKKLEGFIEKYKEESPMVLQLYVYLSNYYNKPLDSIALKQMKAYFELCKKNSIRILLRFAYQTESTKDAKYKWVEKHLEQIGEWFKDNSGLVNDTLYAVQGGIVGYWGEGHGNKNFKQKYIGKAFSKLCEILPKHLFLQIRLIGLTKDIDEKHKNTLAMHHDYIIGDLSHPWGYTFDEDEEKHLEYFKSSINDGELPWGRAYMNDDNSLEPLNNLPYDKLLPEIARYHLTTLSLEHNYREAEGPNTPYTLKRWQDIYISQDELKNMNLPFNPNLFICKDKTQNKVSAFEYLQQHLGYHLVLSNAKIEENEISFTISNFGMASPNNFDLLSVFVGESEYVIKDFDKTLLSPNNSIKIELKLEQKINETDEIGIKLSNKAFKKLGIRFANDLPFKNNIQYIACMNLSK